MKALEGFRRAVSETNTNQLLTVLEAVYANSCPDDVREIVDEARDARLTVLVTKPRFEELILNDAALGLELVKKLMSEGVLTRDLRAMVLVPCENQHNNLRKRDDFEGDCTYCGSKLAGRYLHCWVKGA